MTNREKNPALAGAATPGAAVTEAAAACVSALSEHAADLPFARRTRTGKIKTRVMGKQNAAVALTLGILAGLTVFSRVTMNYGKVAFFTAVGQAAEDFLMMMLQPGLAGHFTLADVVTGLFVSIALAVLTTFIGAVIAFVLSLFAAVNLSNRMLRNAIKALMSFFRAVPTILWVQIKIFTSTSFSNTPGSSTAVTTVVSMGRYLRISGCSSVPARSPEILYPPSFPSAAMSSS